LRQAADGAMIPHGGQSWSILLLIQILAGVPDSLLIDVV
jgi:hypothetical protein